MDPRIRRRPIPTRAQTSHGQPHAPIQQPFVLDRVHSTPPPPYSEFPASLPHPQHGSGSGAYFPPMPSSSHDESWPEREPSRANLNHYDSSSFERPLTANSIHPPCLSVPQPSSFRNPTSPASPSFTSSSSFLEPNHPPLRFTRSATNLRASHDSPRTDVPDPRGQLPVDFVVDSLPIPDEPPAPRQVRRVKSSSALTSNGAAPDSNAANAKWKSALGEAQYFAGGLIARPAESTRHYSIIRHSHALIWYRGPSTSLMITILSDTDIPSNRTLWLQRKGYSGNVGMTLKAMVGGKGDWIDVTPANRAEIQDVPEMDERGIQRDLKRFKKKASGKQKAHVPRETHVVRIPAHAEDGYFRLVLCAGENGKKILCGCPVFRVASTSTDISVVRGAGIRTMPLEVGVKVGTTVAQQFAKRYTGPATAVVQSRAGKAMGNQVVKRTMNVGSKVVGTGRFVAKQTGVEDHVVEGWKRGKDGRYAAVVHDRSLDDGDEESQEPEAQFPVSLEGKVVRGTGRMWSELGIPTANLSGVRDEIKMRWRGVYAAWASVVTQRKDDELSHDWHEAIVTVGPLRHSPPEVVAKNRVTVHILHDFDEATFFDHRVRVVLMGYLHPSPEKDEDPDELARQHDEDTMTVMASLARDGWSIEDALRRDRTLAERLDGVTGMVQNTVDRIPLHWVGARTEGSNMRDKVYGTGGLWIPR